jgi:hypothetical protein
MTSVRSALDARKIVWLRAGLVVLDCLVAIQYLWAAYSVGGWFITYELSQYDRVLAGYYLVSTYLGLAFLAGTAALFQWRQWRFRQPLQLVVGVVALALVVSAFF